MAACTSCGADQPAGAKFCNECGASLARGCPECGAALPEGAKFCNDCGADLRGDARPLRDQPAAPVSSRRITSVLFGDLVGFTPLSESRDQEDVRELLSRYFEECSRIVARYGGVVEKFIGDAVMAVWGVPTTHEDDAERSVRAGLELVAAATALGSEVGVGELAMRVGIVTGEVAVTVGARMQGMVAGDPVNTASRVQSAAAPGQVWVDETTRLLTSAAISYADVGSHHLKGKAEPMPLWAARAVVAHAGGGQRADGLEAPLAGRARELRVVKEVYHRVAELGRPALLLVVGDAGVGKTRLGWEFSKYTDGLADACRWHNGKCVSYGEGVAFYALAEALRSRLEAARDADDGEAVDATALIEKGLAAYVAEPAEQRWLAPRLGALLGTSGTSSFQRADLFSAWTTFFERVSEGTKPVVMLIDDAQHADEGLVRFLEHLMAAATFPCFVMLLTRPELASEHPELVTNRRATVLNLEPLSSPDMATLVDGLVEGLSASVRDELVDRAEGIPTYAVETVRALIDRDLVVPRGGAYVLADPDALDLTAIGAPASLQALVSARLDLLSPDERRVVDRASVAGGSVEPALLQELCDDMSDLDETLVGLVRAQILSVDLDRLSSEHGRYQFVQSVVRQVAYSTLSRRERKQTHLRLLDAISRDGAPELAPVAAQHAVSAIEAGPEEADVPELSGRAVALLRQAAARAHGLGAPAEAAGHLRRALELVDAGAEQQEIRLSMATAFLDVGRYDDALAQASAARAGFAALDDLPREAIAAAALARALVDGPADHEGAIELLEPYYHRLKDVPTALEAFGEVIRTYSSALSRVGRNTVELGLETIQVAERAGDTAGVARGLLGLAIQVFQIRHQLVGTMLLEQAIVIAREAGTPHIEGRSLATLGAALHAEDLVRSLSTAQLAVEVTARAGQHETASLAKAALATVQWATGNWDAIDHPDLDDAHPDDRAQIATLAGLVLAARGLSPVEMVQGSARRSYGSHWNALGDALIAAYRGAPGSLELFAGAVDDVYETSGLLDEFTAVYGAVLSSTLGRGGPGLYDRLAAVVDDATELPQQGLRAHRALVEALRSVPAQQPDEEVERHFGEALSGYDAWGSMVFGARARAAYGVWLTENGRIAEAEPLLKDARTTYSSLGAVAWLDELEQALAAHHVGS